MENISSLNMQVKFEEQLHELSNSFVNLRKLLADRDEKMIYWIEYSETEVDIRIESLKIQLDELNTEFSRKLEQIENGLKVENLERKLVSRKTKSIKICEKFLKNLTRPLNRILNVSTRSIESQLVGDFHKYIPKYKDAKEALDNKHADDLEYYLKNSNQNVKEFRSDYGSLLDQAAAYGNCELVKILLMNNADPNNENILTRPLMKAVQYNTEDVVKLLLRKGANIENGKGSSAVKTAIENNRLRMLEILVENNARFDEIILCCYESYDFRTTVFHFAFISGANTDIIKFILNHMDVNFKDQHALIEACKKRFRRNRPLKDIVKILLENKADVNAKDLKGNTPLHYASRHELLDVAIMLLDYKAQVNIQNINGDTALISGCRYDPHYVVQLLIFDKADIHIKNLKGETALFKAVRYCHHVIVKMLLNNGASVRVKNILNETVLMKNAIRGSLKVFKLLIESDIDVNARDRNGNTALMMASSRGKRKLVEQLVINKAEINAVNKNEQTALHLACVHGKANIVKILINANVDLNLRDSLNNTPIMIAFINSNAEAIYLLLSAGAKLDVGYINSCSLIDKALNTIRNEYKLKHAIMILMKTGADINVKGNLGQTPLMTEIAEYLLKSSADLNLKDDNGLTALMIASKYGLTAIVDLMLENGADVNAKDNNGETAYQKAFDCEILTSFHDLMNDH